MSSLSEPPERSDTPCREIPLFFPFRQREAIDDPLSELAREGARRMLAQVLIAEAHSFVAMWKDLKLPDGRDRVVRHGHGPHRAIQTGVGPVEVRRAKVRDRGDVGAEEKIRFTSSILPKWARRTKSLDALLPVLRGVSTGDFQEAPCGPLGQGRAEHVAGGDLAADGRMARDYDALAEARPLGAAIRVCVGGRGLPAGPNGRSHTYADDDRTSFGPCGRMRTSEVGSFVDGATERLRH